MSPFSKTLETRSLTAGESEIESLKSERALLIKRQQARPPPGPALYTTATEPNVAFDS